MTHLPEDAVSRTSETSVGMASVAGSESVMFDDLYDLSNRAKLPRGVENIRPHLEHVDNVPLLVPLFTDCTPEGDTFHLRHFSHGVPCKSVPGLSSTKLILWENFLFDLSKYLSGYLSFSCLNVCSCNIFPS